MSDADAEAELELAEAEARAKAKRAPVKVEPLKEFDRGALARDTPTIPREQPSGIAETFDPKTVAGTIARKFGQGASFGWGDELAGAGGAMQELEGRHPVLGRIANVVAGATVPPLQLAKSGVDISSFDPAHPLTPPTDAQKQQFADDPSAISAVVKRYLLDRNAQRRELATSGEAHPYISKGAEIAGSLAVPVPGMGAVRTLPQFATAAKVGAGTGALSALGGAEGSAAEQAGTTALGGVAGGVLGPVFGSLSTRAGDFIARQAKELRNMGALQAFLQSGIQDRLKKQGMTPEEGRALAGRLYERGLIPFGSEAEGIAQRMADAKVLPGEQIETALQDLTSTGVPFDFNRAAAAMSRAGAKSENLAPGTSVLAINLANNKKAEALADIARRQGDITQHAGNLGWLDANATKSQAWQGANFSQDAKAEPEAYRRAVAALRDEIEKQGAAAWLASGKGLDPQFRGLPTPSESLASANDVYGDLSRAQLLAEDKASRSAAHKLVSPAMATMGAIGGQLMGGHEGAGIGAVALPVLSKLATTRGGSSLAGAAQLASKASGSPAAQYIAGQGAKFGALQSWLEPKKPEAITDVQQDPEAGLTPEQRKAKRAEDFAAEMRGR